jgi:hypothetical protein
MLDLNDAIVTKFEEFVVFDLAFPSLAAGFEETGNQKYIRVRTIVFVW